MNLYLLVSHRSRLLRTHHLIRKTESRWPVLPHHGKPIVEIDGVLQKETRERDGKELKLVIGPKGQL